MYAEQAHCHLADANFYFFKDKDFFRSRAEGAPLWRHLGYFARGKNPGLATRIALAKLRFDPLSSRHQNLGGAERDRTADPLLAKQVLSQLSYSPIQVSIPDQNHQTGAKLHVPHGTARPERSGQRPQQRQDKEWWARADSNCRPHAYQACALTT
jgi:hypothetical protein